MLGATFCDSKSATASVYPNLKVQQPYDYDLGSPYGGPLASHHAAGDTELCIPIKMYSLAVVEQFQFVLRFGSILECSSLSCGL